MGWKPPNPVRLAHGSFAKVARQINLPKADKTVSAPKSANGMTQAQLTEAMLRDPEFRHWAQVYKQHEGRDPNASLAAGAKMSARALQLAGQTNGQWPQGWWITWNGDVPYVGDEYNPFWDALAIMGTAATGVGVANAAMAGGSSPAAAAGASAAPAATTGLQGNESFLNTDAFNGGAAPSGGGLNGFDWGDATRLGLGLGAAALTRPDGSDLTFGGGAGVSYPPELQELLSMSLDRMRAQGPLFDAINAQAIGGLPRGAGTVPGMAARGGAMDAGMPRASALPAGSTDQPRAGASIDDLIQRLRAQFAGGA